MILIGEPSGARRGASEAALPPRMPVLQWSWLGRVGYRPVAALQERLRQRVLAGGDEQLLLLEHDPVVTLGRSSRAEHLLVPEELARRGIAVEKSTRGGQVTYHGPGQLVAYAIVRVKSVVAHVEALCGAAVEVAAKLGVAARFRRDCPGVWVPKNGEEKKLASVGVHVHRRVTVHGLALNVSTALDPFSLIVACGAGSPPTSLAQESNGAPTVSDLAAAYAGAFARALGRDPLHSPPPPVE
jgi:lipoyl(octanoyl) transferase